MKSILKQSWLAVLLVLSAGLLNMVQAYPDDIAQDEEPAILVGRIMYVDGQVWRYVPAEEDWVEVVTDAPFGEGDILYTDKFARAEFVIPNNTWIRIDEKAQIQLVSARESQSEIDVDSGTYRFYNKSAYVVLRVETPFGHVMAPEKTSFDLYVNEDRVEVIVLEGSVDFFHTASGERFEVIAGESSLTADSRRVLPGKNRGDAAWERWNRDRDQMWAKRLDSGTQSVQYLPAPLHYDAHVFDDYGRWEKVYYSGGYHHFWRPVHVRYGWAPFTNGRWTVWYGDHTWIPYEPFGYVTHHYGNWVHASGRWYWAPPSPRVAIHAGGPFLGIRFAWYPGRVAWLHSTSHIGWIPLGPHEPYYSHRRWGHRSIIIRKTHVGPIHIHKYKYRDRAVVIERGRFYKVKNYRHANIRHIRSADARRGFHGARVIDSHVIRDYRNDKHRYRFTDKRAGIKPRIHLSERHHQNRTRAFEVKRNRNVDMERLVKQKKRQSINNKRRVSRKHDTTPSRRDIGIINEKKTKKQEREIKKRRTLNNDRERRSVRRPIEIKTRTEAKTKTAAIERKALRKKAIKDLDRSREMNRPLKKKTGTSETRTKNIRTTTQRKDPRLKNPALRDKSKLRRSDPAKRREDPDFRRSASRSVNREKTNRSQVPVLERRREGIREAKPRKSMEGRIKSGRTVAKSEYAGSRTEMRTPGNSRPKTNMENRSGYNGKRSYSRGSGQVKNRSSKRSDYGRMR